MLDDIRKLSRPVVRRLKRLIQKSKDVIVVRRATAVLALAAGQSVTQTSRQIGAARSSIQAWRELFLAHGIYGLEPMERGRSNWTITPAFFDVFLVLLRQTPQQCGYLRTRWSSELLACVMTERGHPVHASTVRRLLKALGFAYRRARPALNRKVPGKAAKIAALRAAEARLSAATPVFHVDEADIDLNPRIAPQWTPIGQQPRVNTPGQNAKHYLAGALHIGTGNVVYAEHSRKNSALFIALLEKLKRQYRRAKTIVIILDNYSIHKSRQAKAWLQRHPKFELVFQPAWHPWLNVIERLWKQLHDTVTRNHQRSNIRQLMEDVRCFMANCQPFPGSSPALARL